MCFLMYLLLSALLVLVCSKLNINPLSDSVMIILAILTCGEVITWMCRK